MHLLSKRQSKREVERLLRQSRRRARDEARESRVQTPKRPVRRVLGVVSLATVGLFVAALALPAFTAGSAGAIDAAALDGDLVVDGTQSLEISAQAPKLQREGVGAKSVIESFAAAAGLPSVPCARNDAGTLRWPLDGGCIITSGFGSRFDSYYGSTAFHAGVDLTPGEGTPIRAMADGVVTDVADDTWGYGTNVVLWHPEWKVYSVYGHMIYGSYNDLKIGDRVEVGDQLGNVGSTGKSTGAHLHFEIREDDGAGGQTPVDPVQWMSDHID